MKAGTKLFKKHVIDYEELSMIKTMTKDVERWGVFEVRIIGPTQGNPFVDYEVKGVFTGKNEKKEVVGFYDGEGIYVVRFMPSFIGAYTVEITSNFSEECYLDSFNVYEPMPGNHGPVHVANTYHFAYEDGTPYYPVGTTCYVWTMQPPELQHKTLQTLANGYFNKIRFCILPKHYDYNLHEPISYPYEGSPMDSSILTKENFNDYQGACEGNHFDLMRFNPQHFQMIEQRIIDLMKLGIEADIIVMHPYDRWGFSEMSPEEDDLYWKYVVARFSAYRNVWWSLANEYDLMLKKKIADWERYAEILCNSDPYNHLRSIHNQMHFYDYSRPWITHCCIQRIDLHKTAEYTYEWMKRYQKPVVLDEIAYEGNLDHCWGNITAKEMVRRFWEAAIRGGYAGHGETYCHPQDIIWWSHGGELYGESPERIKFLHKILSETPGLGLKHIPSVQPRQKYAFDWDDVVAVPQDDAYQGQYYLLYYGIFRPASRSFHLDDENEYDVEVIDTWDMTICDVGRFKGKFTIELPSKQFMAIRLTRV